MAVMAMAVTSVITRHQSSADFSKGRTDKIIVDSAGTLRLAQQSSDVNCGGLLDDAWSIHTILADPDGSLFLGTGPNAKVVRYDGRSAEQVYPPVSTDPNETADSTIRNEHVFALAQDMAGRLLIGVSGLKGKLIRLGSEAEEVFADGRVQYIFAIAKDEDNNIYLGTGPEGLVFRLDPFCRNPEVLWDAKDKSILSLSVNDGILYAGSDQRGLIYKIDPAQKQASVLYDTDQDEVPALCMDAQGNVYAAATSAQAAMIQLQTPAVPLKRAPGHPEIPDAQKKPVPVNDLLNTANSDETKDKKEETPTPPPQPVPQPPAPPSAKAAGHVYKITPDGFVTDVFSEMAVLYSLHQADGKLWVGSGNKGQFFAIDPEADEQAIVFEDKTSTQITSAVRVADKTYLGLSNPARLVRLEPTPAKQGMFESALLDAGQPAQWGKLQVEADIPSGSRITMACRSGNVQDPNDATFSGWSAETDIAGAMILNCPVARFCQYRLTLTPGDDGASPVVREVSAAFVIPNLAPVVTAVKAERTRDPKKPNVIEIAFAVRDDNRDELEYALEFRKLGRTVWIPLKEQLDQNRYEWDSLTAEDGRYEVRVTSSDRKSNTPETTLLGSRISDPFVIDNSAPQITQADVNVEGSDAVVGLSVTDVLSVMGRVQYTVDSNEKWMTALPDDGVYDTLTETFTVRIEDLKPGEHVIAFSVADDLKNTMYKTYEVTIP
jgi:outer membrane protein assembly factor BamB